jgi:quercetin dioxygenase-like cupin family protein
MSQPPAVLVYDAIEWDDPLAARDARTRPPEELVARARELGARRKRIVRGEGGFYMNRSVLPPGWPMPVHEHDHDELLVVLRGSCTLDDGKTHLRADDSLVIPAHTAYGFTCGPDGMEFLTIRRGDSSTTLVR